MTGVKLQLGGEGLKEARFKAEASTGLTQGLQQRQQFEIRQHSVRHRCTGGRAGLLQTELDSYIHILINHFASTNRHVSKTTESKTTRHDV